MVGYGGAGGKGARHAAVRREYGTTYQDVLDKGDGTDGSFCKRVLLNYSECVDNRMNKMKRSTIDDATFIDPKKVLISNLMPTNNSTQSYQYQRPGRRTRRD